MCPLPKNLGYATGICEHKFVISILIYLLYPLVVKLVSSVPVNEVPGVPRRRSVDSSVSTVAVHVWDRGSRAVYSPDEAHGGRINLE